MRGSIKYPYPPHGGLLKILMGQWGGGGEGGRGQTKKLSVGGIFWKNKMHINCTLGP